MVKVPVKSYGTNRGGQLSPDGKEVQRKILERGVRIWEKRMFQHSLENIP